MKILVADKFPDRGVRTLRDAGFEVVHDAGVSEEVLPAKLAESGADVLVVRGKKVSAAAIEAGRLGLIVRAGAGVNTIDLAAASRRGIYVSNCPGKNSIAVAELAFGLILSVDRRIPDSVIDLRVGKWNKKEYGKADGLFGKTLGLIGVGQIGREMIPRARAFGLDVVAWSRSLTPMAAEALGVIRAASIEDVAADADILSVHLALNKETRGIIGERVFAALKPRAIFINTSRGEVVDQVALENAIKEKGIRAGLDVFAREPSTDTGAFEDGIVKLGVYGTHHIGASTAQAQEAIADETVRIIREYRDTGKVPNVVNLCAHSPATHMLVVRHRDRPGVLAHVLDALRAAGINVQEMENVIFDGIQAAIARIAIDAPLSPETVEQVRAGHRDILALEMVELR